MGRAYDPINYPGSTGIVSLGEGGNGGTSQNPGLPGGRGGTVEITEDFGLADSFPIQIGLYGKGGAGFNGCSVTPEVNGTDGGQGGALTVHGRPYTAVSSFLGGNGGDGDLSGQGGQGGTDDGGKLLPNGRLGRSCPFTGASIRLDSAIVWQGRTEYQAGAVLQLSNVYDGHLSGPEGGCSGSHLHANGPG